VSQVAPSRADGAAQVAQMIHLGELCRTFARARDTPARDALIYQNLRRSSCLYDPHGAAPVAGDD
jgi:hypothetical protein